MAKKKGSKRIKLFKGPHKLIRTPCPHCKSRHTKNVDRFHGYGSFCKTHKTTKVGRQYCKQSKAKKAK